MARMERAGAQVTHERVDVSDDAAVKAALSRARERVGKISGIMHAAGVLEDATLAEQSWDKLAKVLRPKALGAQVLKRHAPEAEYFGNFGSIAAVVGNGGQSNYAAANAYLSGLALSDASERTQTIAWWAWAGAGMAAERDEQRARLAHPLSLQEGLSALEQAMHHGGAEVVVSPLDFQAAAKSSTVVAHSAKFRDLVTQAKKLKPGEETDFVRELATLPDADRPRFVAERIRQEIFAVVGSELTIAPTQPLMELGLDSLMAVELRNRLSALIGHTLPASFVFDYPNIAALAAALIEKFSAKKKTLPTSTETPIITTAELKDRLEQIRADMRAKAKSSPT